MSLLDWLTGGRSKKPELPRPDELVAGGERIAALFGGGRVEVWSLDGQLEQTLESSSPGIAIRPDGSELALADGRTLDLNNGAMRVHAAHRGQPFFLPDGELLVVGWGELTLGPVGDPHLRLEAPGLDPSANLRVAHSRHGIALLDPAFNDPLVLQEGELRTFEHRPAQVMGGCWDGDALLTIQQGMVRRWSPEGAVEDESRPHPLQTLNVGPGGISVGLDIDNAVQLRVGGQVMSLPRPAPNRPELSVLDDGVLVELHRGYAWWPLGAAEPVVVELEGGRRRPIQARGGRARVGPDLVALATAPMTLYRLSSGSCARVFEPA